MARGGAAPRSCGSKMKRGLLDLDLPGPLRPWANVGPSTDLLVGAKTIAELDVGDLRYLLGIASTRREYLEHLMNVLEAGSADENTEGRESGGRR